MCGYIALILFYIVLFCFSELNLEIPEEKISSIANNASTKLNATLLELRRLFLVENMLDSIKYDNQPFTRSNNEFWFLFPKFLINQSRQDKIVLFCFFIESSKVEKNELTINQSRQDNIVLGFFSSSSQKLKKMNEFEGGSGEQLKRDKAA